MNKCVDCSHETDYTLKCAICGGKLRKMNDFDSFMKNVAFNQRC